MIDLHTHSAVSDGTLSPTALVEAAHQAGITVLALTDHDTIHGLDEAEEAARRLNIRFISGIELSCSMEMGTVHLLGYGFNHRNETLQDALIELQQWRAQRNDRLVVRLQELGFAITIDDVVAYSDTGVIGRPHFARALIAAGHFSTIDDVFTQLLAKGQPAYVRREGISAPEAITLIHSAGGLAVWAHPLLGAPKHLRDKQQLISMIEILAEAGLDGIEAWHSRFSPEERDTIAEIAQKLGLLATGGSDFHGDNKPGIALGIGHGDLIVPSHVAEVLQLRQASKELFVNSAKHIPNS